MVSGSESKTYAPAPEGAHRAVCVDIIDQGMKPNKFKPGTEQHKVDIAWQIEEKRDDGKRFVVYKRYTASLSDKANLRHDLEGWRGRKFTAEELAGFDLETIVGANCIVNVVHKKSEDGTKTYANVAAVMPLMKGLPKLAAEGYERKATAEVEDDGAPPHTDEDAVNDLEDAPF